MTRSHSLSRYLAAAAGAAVRLAGHGPRSNECRGNARPARRGNSGATRSRRRPCSARPSRRQHPTELVADARPARRSRLGRRVEDRAKGAKVTVRFRTRSEAIPSGPTTRSLAEHSTGQNVTVSASLAVGGKSLTARPRSRPRPTAGGRTRSSSPTARAYRPGHTLKFVAFLRTPAVRRRVRAGPRPRRHG